MASGAGRAIVRACACAVAVSAGAGVSLRAQATQADPHQAQPERPTVATHAFTVAPGFVEIETGVLRQPTAFGRASFAMPLVVKIGAGTRLQLDIVPGVARVATEAGTHTGVTDLGLAAKWHVADGWPVLGAFAVQPSVTLPTGSAERGTGAGHPSASLLLISSHSVGVASVDVNLGATATGGDGRETPTRSGLWCVAAGLPLAGVVGLAVELFGTPGTAGPAGGPPTVGFLAGPTFTLRPSFVADAGVIVSVRGLGRTALYAGFTWNVGSARRRATTRPSPSSNLRVPRSPVRVRTGSARP